MAKSCIYCKIALNDESVVDVCRRCGIGVWGEKMFATIIENMEGAKEKGDLYQGSVTDPNTSQSKPKKSPLGSMAKEAVAAQDQNKFEQQYNLKTGFA